MQQTKMPAMQISEKVKDIPEALSIYINQLVYNEKRNGKDITVLSLGEAFFDIPVFDFNSIDFVKGYHYSDSQGIPELRYKIAEYYEGRYNVQVNADSELLITAGSKPIIFMAMQAVLNPGDEVLIHEPAWLSYQEQLKLVGAIPKFIPYDCTPENFHQHMTSKTRMIIINNPNNPSGWMYSRDNLRSIYDQCRPKGIYVLVDEAYSDFSIDNNFTSLANVVPDKDGIIIVNSLSKNMGMSGWRVGYVISTPEVIEYILKINQHVITCGSTVLLYYLAKYFDNILEVTLPQVTEVVEKRNRLAKFMDSIGLKYMDGHSTFYFFVNIEDFPESSLTYALQLLLFEGISVVPGSAYGKSTERFVRVSIGVDSEERIHAAMHKMKALIKNKNFDIKPLQQKMKEENIKEFS